MNKNLNERMGKIIKEKMSKIIKERYLNWIKKIIKWVNKNNKKNE